MLDRILANALEGLTIIEDDSGALGMILANQMGAYAEAGGKRVGHFSIAEGGLAGLGDFSSSRRSPPRDEDPGVNRTVRGTQQLLGIGQRYAVKDDAEYDLIVIEGLSVYLYDKTVREVIDIVRFVVSQSRQKRSFIIPFEKTILGERTSSYLKAQADSVIVVRTEVSSDRIQRSLLLQKVRNSNPSDKLVKFTLDENGIQVDTREFLG